MTEYEICGRARRWLESEPDGVKVSVSYAGTLHVGKLTRVSPVNAWIKVSGKGQIPTSLITRLEYAG